MFRVSDHFGFLAFHGIVEPGESPARKQGVGMDLMEKLLSEKAVAAVKGRRKAGPQDSFMEALACGAGFFEEQYDKEISGAPFQVQALLQVRAHAYSMVNASHLGSWALYNTRFMEFYTQECGDHYRFLTAVRRLISWHYGRCLACATVGHHWMML